MKFYIAAFKGDSHDMYDSSLDIIWESFISILHK